MENSMLQRREAEKKLAPSVGNSAMRLAKVVGNQAVVRLNTTMQFCGQFHHIIPKELWKDPMLVDMAPDEFLDGIGVDLANHYSNHSSYTSAVKAALEHMNNTLTGLGQEMNSNRIRDFAHEVCDVTFQNDRDPNSVNRTELIQRVNSVLEVNQEERQIRPVSRWEPG